MFIGTALFSYYQITGSPLPADIRPDEVFPIFIMSKLPVGVIGLILSALIAAAFSSLDSDLNCLSAICLEDYWLRWNPNTPEKKQMLLSRLFIVFAGAGAIGVAMFYIHAGGEGVLGIIFTLYSIFSGGIAGMFLLGIFSRKANKKGMYFGIVASILFTLYAMLTSSPLEIGGENVLLMNLGKFNFNQHPYMIGVYSHIVLMIVAFVSSYFFKSKPVAESLTYYGWQKLKREGTEL
jgi:SSS family solute:Na+ symporter